MVANRAMAIGDGAGANRMIGPELITAIVFLLGIVSAVGTLYWRWGGAIGKVRDDLAAHKLHVAEHYVSKQGHREATEQIMDAIGSVKASIDGTNQRIDRLWEERSKPASRRSS